MTEILQSKTTNGYEIEKPRETLSLVEMKEMMIQYGIEGSNPLERVDGLRKVNAKNIALFITDLNKRAQGSDNTLVHEKSMTVGDDVMIAPEDRYDLFCNVVDQVHAAPVDTNPERIGDTLALANVLLHPFKDGNGRTSRLLGFMMRDDFDAPDASETFDQLAAPRDIARAEGGFIINGYIPYIDEGLDRSDPAVVEQYIGSLLSEPNEELYTGPYGQAELKYIANVPETV